MRGFPDFLLEKNTEPYERYLEKLEFYAGDQWRPSRKSFFNIPETSPPSEVINTRPYQSGTNEIRSFPSRYEVRNPAVSEEFNQYLSNLTGYLHLWRHETEGPRPLVLCLHGFMMGDSHRAERMFRIKSLFAGGVDVGLYVAPFHARRLGRGGRQHILDPANIPLTLEAFGQNIHDLHSTVLLLKELGYTKVGLIGASLGGFTCALYATFNAPVDFMFMVVPAVSFSSLLKPRDSRFSFKVDSDIVSRSEEALEIISPRAYCPGFDPEKICVVAHAGDRLCEPRFTRELVEKWSIPNFVEVIGGHWLYFDRSVRGDTWYGWLKRMGYLEA